MIITTLRIPVVKATQRDFYRTLHSIADRMQPRVRRGFLAAVDKVQRKTTLAELEQAIKSGDIESVERAVGLDANMGDTLREQLTSPLRTVLADAGQRSVKALPSALQGIGRFDLLNPRVTEFLDNYDFALVQGLTNKTRDGLRKIVTNAFEEGGHPYDQAKRIQRLVGLTEKQAGAVETLRRQLEKDGRSQSFITRTLDQYSARLLYQRATNIARTETIRAANAGQQALWYQAEEQNLIVEDQTRREWIITPDDRLCPLCEGIPDRNQDGVKLSEPFDSDDGPIDLPPAHPSCRCAVALAFLD